MNKLCAPEVVAGQPGATSPGAVVVRERAQVGLGAGLAAGMSGGNRTGAGYLLGLIDRPGRADAAWLGQFGTSTVKASTVQMSTVHNSNDQRNAIGATSLVPASRREVGPHPVREAGPA